jgi:hypothetical protein
MACGERYGGCGARFSGRIAQLCVQGNLKLRATSVNRCKERCIQMSQERGRRLRPHREEVVKSANFQASPLHGDGQAHGSVPLPVQPASQTPFLRQAPPYRVNDAVVIKDATNNKPTLPAGSECD